MGITHTTYSEFLVQSRRAQILGWVLITGVLISEYILSEIGQYYPTYWKLVISIIGIGAIYNIASSRIRLKKTTVMLISLLIASIAILFMFYRVINENFNVILVFQLFIGVSFTTLMIGQTRYFNYWIVLYVSCFIVSLINIDISIIEHVAYILGGVLATVFFIFHVFFKNKRVKAIGFSELILNTYDKIVIICNLKGDIVYINPYSFKLLNLAGKEQFDDDVWNMFGFESNGISIPLKCIRKCRLEDDNINIYHQSAKLPNSQIKELEWQDKIIDDKHFIKIGTDITSLKLANEQAIIAKAQLENSNKNMVDSISYAKRIQTKMLPELNYIEKVLPESFFYYKPKDIVSGDFYWVKKIGEKVIIAVADCTGHGVPGAIITFVGSAALNDAVIKSGILDPSEILNHVDSYVKDALSSNENTPTDGMDIGIISIDLSNKVVQYSGARRPLIIFDHETEEIVKIDSSRKSIGEFLDFKSDEFKTQYFPFKNECSFYLFTDGIQDQFGGDRLKKFGIRRVMDHFTSINDISMNQQLYETNKVFNEWTNDFTISQTDDMLLFGMRLTDNYFTKFNKNEKKELSLLRIE